MKYTPSPLLSELSGAAGSVVASHNRFGPYLRTRTIPVNPNTAAQQTYRNTLKSASQAWRLLTDGARNAWEAAAANLPRINELGATYYMTGHQFFVSTCQAIKLYDPASAFPSLPNTVITPVDLTSITPAAAAGAGTNTLTFAATPVPATTKLVIEATRQLSAGVTFVGRSNLRIVQIIAPAGASPANIAAAYVTLFGNLIAGKKIMYRAYEISSTGGRTNKLSAIITVAA